MAKKTVKRKNNIRAKYKKARKKFDHFKSKNLALSNNQMSHLLAAGVAHEFNNILGAVDGHAEWAMNTQKVEDAFAALATIRQACARSARVTRSLQLFSQPIEENYESIDLKKCVGELQKEFAPLILKTGVEMRVGLPEGLKFLGVRVRIEEVLRNLFKNSFEAFSSPWAFEANKMEQEGKFVSIRFVKNSKNRGKLLFEISDNGPGIPEIYRDMVFQPFFTTKGVLKALQGRNSQGESSGSQHYGDFAGGSGLGLYRSRAIAMEHGGSLSLQSSSSKGTTWHLILPS